MSKSKSAGVSTGEVEVTSISGHGSGLYLGGRELFVDFRGFPWFAEAPISKVLNVLWPAPDHLAWPDLDVDLSVESIEHPERFPLCFG
ncbi:MAG TPA: DUF2442 domain-containing protein [Thermoanaerobaculia bacterium]|jgi:hypothetical protein|nr:DUF2442 domain-containing protein [Thermoanaerobaculia bacterium]